MSSQTLPIGEAAQIHGAIALETTDRGIQPWRIHHDRIRLYEPLLLTRAMDAAGVRVALVSDTSTLGLTVDPRFDLKSAQAEADWSFDLLVDGRFHQRVAQARAAQTIRFDNIPAGTHRLEVYLPHGSPIAISQVLIDAGASASAFKDDRPRWVVYGSSITQCRSAAGPSETWPALVARRFDLNLTCLGYGGNCQMEPMVTRLIRDQPADYLSLCLGINVMGAGSYNHRTFRAAVIGTILTIRDGHPDTPMVVVSPICNPPRETTPNVVDMTLMQMREQIADAVDALVSRGDANLYYVDGLTVFGPDYVKHMPDQLHPDAEGYRVLAQRYAEVVMPKLGAKPRD